MHSETSISVQGLSKKYKMYPTPGSRILEALSFGRKQYHREHWALRDVSFDVHKGRTLGVIGANGAGKSTLLKILARTSYPTSGRFTMEGRVSSMLELGAGFHMEFSGRQNLMMNGIIMGFTPKEMRQKFDEILEFSELGRYIDEPVRTYSSGMAMRLGFSVAVNVDPDILIIDEIFAVGDMHFQKKCVDKIFDFKNRGKTILFCSHSLYDVRQLCDDAIWIKEGHLERYGPSELVTNDYAAFERSLDLDLTSVLEQVPESEVKDRRRPHITSFQVVHPETGEPIHEVKPGDALDLKLAWENPDPERMPIHVGLGFLRSDTTLCMADSTQFDGITLDGEKGMVTYHVPHLRLLSGTFVVFAILFDGAGIHRYDTAHIEHDLVVLNRGKEVGLFLQDHSWKVDSYVGT
ncbi:MAG: ATP-binding cassette domain-containing protein [Planctomycetes bacterium]|nr:ATP-binding cassette domain-containing protein [Planctomycetota bacterium]